MRAAAFRVMAIALASLCVIMWADVSLGWQSKSPADSGKKSSKSKSTKSIPGTQIGDQVKDITGEDVDGEEFSLSDYQGKVIMLDFWGDW